MYIDSQFIFGIAAFTNNTSRNRSTDVYDSDPAGSAELATPAVRLFAGPKVARLNYRTVMTADADPSIRIEFVAADNLLLTTLPIVLGDSGLIATTADGTALLSGELVEGSFMIKAQTVAKRYYGCFVQLGGTNPDILVQANQLYITLDSQTNQPGAQVAVPAT